MQYISIHTLQAEGDPTWLLPHISDIISIHTLQAEGDVSSLLSVVLVEIFQSTPSKRRVTKAGDIF